ncbi:B-block binding subunit of TFIIIC, partial [Striga asiatica]
MQTTGRALFHKFAILTSENARDVREFSIILDGDRYRDLQDVKFSQKSEKRNSKHRKKQLEPRADGCWEEGGQDNLLFAVASTELESTTSLFVSSPPCHSLPWLLRPFTAKSSKLDSVLQAGGVTHSESLVAL